MALLRSKPLRQRSEKAKARDLVLARTKRVILKRAGGHCEAFGERFLPSESIDRHHIFPNKYLGLPWSDSAEAGAAVCRTHHDYVQTHPQCDQQLWFEFTAMRRLLARLEAEGGKVDLSDQGSVRRCALLIVEALEALGVEP